MELPLGTLNIKDDAFLSLFCSLEKHSLSCAGRFQIGLSVIGKIETRVRVDVRKELL